MSNIDYPIGNATSTWHLPVTPLATRNLTYYFVPFYTIVFFLGTFGNGLVITSIVRSSRLRTVTNSYLLNIAIADFLLLLSIPFLIVTIFANGWIFGNILCKMYYNFIHINQYVSSLLLAALSFDRYLAVCHPIRAIEFRTRTKCALIIAGCWLISVLFLCPTWVFATATSERYVLWLGYRVEKCVIDFPAIIFKVPPEIVFTYYAFILGFLFPVSMITTFYILVLVRLNRIRHKHKSEFKQRSHRKVTRIVLAVITAYFICWVPYWFLQIFITIDPLIHSLRLNFSILPANTKVRFLKELTHLTTIIGYANNCLNPVLYVFLSESFREEYLIVLKCFHPSSLFSEETFQPDPVQRRHYYENDPHAAPSIQFTRCEDRARKKVKHSVAIDDLSSHYRSLGLTFPPEHHEKPSTTERQRESLEPKSSGGHRRSRLSLKKGSIINASGHQKAALMVALTINPMRSSQTTMLDDGGVYCGN